MRKLIGVEGSSFYYFLPWEGTEKEWTELPKFYTPPLCAEKRRIVKIELKPEIWIQCGSTPIGGPSGYFLTQKNVSRLEDIYL